MNFAYFLVIVCPCFRLLYELDENLAEKSGSDGSLERIMMLRRQEVLLPLAFLLLSGASADAAPLKSGAEIVDKEGCKHCHIIGGEGSVVAPPLDGIKEHRDRAYLLNRMTGKSTVGKKSKYPLPQEMMSHVRVSRVEAEAIADYLLSLSGKNLAVGGHKHVPDEAPPGSHFVPLAQSASSRRGLKLYKDKGCVACHAVGTIGGKLAPNLAGVGARRSRKFISDRIAEGAILLPKPDQTALNYAMPPSKLSSSEVTDITNWLLTLPPEK